MSLSYSMQYLALAAAVGALVFGIYRAIHPPPPSGPLQLHRPQLSRLSCLLSSLALCLSLIIAIMAFAGIIEVPWDSTFWPAATAFGLVPFCVIAAVIALVSLFINRDGLSVWGLVLGVAAVGVTILVTLLVIVIGIANNPV